MKKRALVLAGGGSRGAYQIGAWKALKELDVDFQGVFGTSIGALNGGLIIQEDLEKALELWENIHVTNVFIDGFDNGLSIEIVMSQPDKVVAFLKNRVNLKGSSNANLRKFVSSNIDIEQIVHKEKALGLVTYNVDRRHGEEFLLRDLPKEHIVDYFVASASCFPAIEMMMINGTRYIDGGYYDNFPYRFAKKEGFEQIIGIDLNPPSLEKRSRFAKEMIYIAPYWPLGSIFDFKQDDAKNNITLGYLDTMKAYNKYHGKLYTFDLQSIEAIDQFEMLFNQAIQQYEQLHTKLEGRIVEGIISLLKTKERHINFSLYCIEDCAKLFNINPYRVYQFEELMIEILYAFNPSLKSTNDEPVGKKSGVVNRQQLVRYFYNKIMIEKNYSYEIYALALSFKDEVVAAVTLSLIQRYFLESKRLKNDLCTMHK